MKFDLFKKKDMTEEEQKEYDRKKNIYTLIGYGLLIIIVIAYVNLIPSAPKDNSNDKSNITEPSNIDDMYDNIKDNYSAKITINYNEEIYTLEIEKDGKKEVGRITDGSTITEYIYDGENYYIIDETGVKKRDDVKPLKNYDDTFTNFTNIKNLIDTSKETTNLEEETHKTRKYKTTLSELLTTYNSVNDTLLATKENKEIIINVNYNKNIESVELDLTDLYVTLGESVENITYKIEYSKVNEIDLTGLEEIINLEN